MNCSRVLEVLGRGGEGKRRDGTSGRFRVRLGVGVAGREDKWEGKNGFAEGLGVGGPVWRG